MKVDFAGTTYANPIRIQRPRSSVFHKDLVGFGGVTSLVGKKRNVLGFVRVIIAGNPAAQGVTLVAEPPTSGALTITWPDASTKSATAYLVEDGAPEDSPEKEIERELVFKLMAILA